MFEALNVKTDHINNKAFIDIRLRPSIAMPRVVLVKGSAFHASPYGPLRPNVTLSIKPEVHNVSQRRQKTTEPRPREMCTFVAIDPAVPEICSQTDRQTDKLIAILRLILYRGAVK